MKYFLGLDLGTSSLKGVLIDENAKIVKEASTDYPLHLFDEVKSEQDPLDWAKAAKAIIAELSQGKENDVRGISIAGQMHGLVLLDQEGKVIRPCILWNDGRSSEETRYLNHAIGKDRLLNLTGNIAFPGFTAPKLMWVEKHEPELYKKIAKILLPKDYLVYVLTGRFSSDYSDAAGTLWLDVANKKWSKEMLEITHCDPAWLPPLFESYEAVGPLLAGRLRR